MGRRVLQQDRPREAATPDPAPRPFDVVFADTCIGGSTVAARLARTRQGIRAFFLADYAVNPLGVKSADQVRAAMDRWVEIARGRSSALVVACNTASVLLRNAPEVRVRASDFGVTVHSMVDFLEVLLQSGAPALEGKRVCLMGTEFTVRQSLYRDLLEKAGAGAVLPLPATRTEGAIAHLRHGEPEERRAILEEIGGTVRAADSVVLACTCFPLVADLLRDLNPGVHLLDPAHGVDRLPMEGRRHGPNLLTIALTGEALTPEEVREQAPVLFPGWVLEDVVTP